MTQGMWAALVFGMLMGLFAIAVNEILVHLRRGIPASSGKGSTVDTMTDPPLRVGGIQEFLLATGYLPSLVEERDVFALSLVETKERYRRDVKHGWFELAAREGDLMLAIQEHLDDLDGSIAEQSAAQAALQEEVVA